MCVRTTISDGLSVDVARVRERLLDAVEADVLAEVLHVPAVRLVAGGDVLGEGDRGVALDRDVVVVPERDQAAEAEVTGERGGLGRDALLQVAVGRDHVRVVIDDLVALAVVTLGQHALAERHAHGRRDALAERPGGGLDAGGVPVLGVPGGRGAELAEVLEVVEREAVPGQVRASSTGASTRARRTARSDHDRPTSRSRASAP